MKWMSRPLNKKITNMKKILYTIYTSLLLAGLVAFTLTSCADDELVKSGEVVEGMPITVTLNLSSTPGTDITVNTRAGDNLSSLSNLVILVFHNDGTFEHYASSQIADGKSKLTFKKTETEGRYSVSFATTTGTKKLIAIANTPINDGDGGFWELSKIQIDELQNKKFDEIKDIIIELRKTLYNETVMQKPIQIVSSAQMLMTGWNEGVTFENNGNGNGIVTDYGTQGDTENKVIAKLDRAMARITFNIKKGNGNFIPSSYRVYNIPVESGLIKSGTNTPTSEQAYVHTESTNIGSVANEKYTFEFYLPENLQVVRKKPDGTDLEYNDREKWTGEKNTAAKDKKWTYAQKGTFVVISGTYSGKANTVDEDGNTVSTDSIDVTGNVEYTIHLGDFNKETGSFGNFSVERNTAYTYNVEVKGVNNIIVEAITDNENQAGAEGEIFTYDASTYTYELDAHYEQVYLEYNLSEIATSISKNLTTDKEIDDAIADNLILIIQSEAMDYTHATESAGEPYIVQNKRGILKPYQIYADAFRNGGETEAGIKKSKVLTGNRDGSLTPQKGFDYKWIEFWPQKGQGIAKYPGVSAWSREDLTDFVNQNAYGEKAKQDTVHLKDVYDVIVAMGKVVKKIYKKNESINTTDYGENGITITKNDKGEYVARFTAFVNEYFYYKHPLTGRKVDTWSVFTNKMPREMIIAMSSKVSEDGNSSFSTIYSYISQLSIQTFYNSRTIEIHGFGIETYNETPHIRFGGPKATEGLSDQNGRENQIKLIGGLNQNWIKFINDSVNGWKNSIGADRTKHKLPVSVYQGTREETNGYAGIGGAYFACLSRNRDLNGNGVIDDNELRWYLPALNEYIRIGIGTNALSNASRLYMGDKMAMRHSGYATNYIWEGSLYFTSSNQKDKRVYWAVERGSYGGEADYTGDFAAKPIRCIRALPSDKTDKDGKHDISQTYVPSEASFVPHENTSPKSIEFRNRMVKQLYRERTDGSLVRHNEDNEAINSFSEGIFVASDYLKENGNYKVIELGKIIGYQGATERGDEYNNLHYERENPCKDYEEGGYKDWRVPNLVELSAMNAAGIFKDYDGGVACCTYFSNPNVRYGFIKTSLITCPGKGHNEIKNKYRIRCVRDVPNGYTFGN